MNFQMKRIWRRFWAHRLAVVGFFFLLALVLAVTLLPLVLRLDPKTSHIDYGFNKPPGAQYILGTDGVGRDIFARLLYGGQVSLLVGISSTLLSMLIGIPLGLLAGYYAGKADAVVMRVADIFMSFPSMMLIMALVSIIGPSLASVILVIGVLGWTEFARLIRGQVMTVRQMPYVESAKAIGTKNMKVMLQYILPNSFSPCLISMTFRTASAILMEAALSFLGMGVQPPMASWGNLMYDAQSIVIISTQPWVWVPPGICLMITVLSINFLGDGLRDAFDPKMKL